MWWCPGEFGFVDQVVETGKAHKLIFSLESVKRREIWGWFRATQLGWIRWCPHAVGGGVGVGGGNCWGAGTRNEFRSGYSGSGRGSDGWNNNRGD
ncbi:hypothetical protein Tco_1294531 [Tanacetum coccineum]